MLNFLRTIDRRWIFALMGFAVALPILLRFSPPTDVTPMDRSVYEAIEALPDGSRVLLSFDFDPGSQGELLPMSTAFTRHCAEKKHKMYFMCLWPLGEPFIENAMAILKEEYPDHEVRNGFHVLRIQARWRGGHQEHHRRLEAALHHRLSQAGSQRSADDGQVEVGQGDESHHQHQRR